MNSTRHVINLILNPRFFSETASYDVVTTIDQTRHQTHFERSFLSLNHIL